MSNRNIQSCIEQAEEVEEEVNRPRKTMEHMEDPIRIKKIKNIIIIQSKFRTPVLLITKEVEITETTIIGLETHKSLQPDLMTIKYSIKMMLRTLFRNIGHMRITEEKKMVISRYINVTKTHQT